MPRIFKYGDIPNISFTPDKELNILIYRSPSYLIIYISHTLLKMVCFLAHPVFMHYFEKILSASGGSVPEPRWGDFRLELCIGMGKTGIPWDPHRNRNKIGHGMGMGMKCMGWELRRGSVINTLHTVTSNSACVGVVA